MWYAVSLLTHRPDLLVVATHGDGIEAPADLICAVPAEETAIKDADLLAQRIKLNGEGEQTCANEIRNAPILGVPDDSKELVDASAPDRSNNAELGEMRADGVANRRQLANEQVSHAMQDEATGIDRSTMASMVRSLARAGLLQRRRTSRDARAYAVKLTTEGERQLRAAQPTARVVDERILDALPAKVREHFVDSLVRIIAALQPADARPRAARKAGASDGPADGRKPTRT
jgi:hypothetical protein